jgi:hypothetical protein
MYLANRLGITEKLDVAKLKSVEFAVTPKIKTAPSVATAWLQRLFSSIGNPLRRYSPAIQENYVLRKVQTQMTGRTRAALCAILSAGMLAMPCSGQWLKYPTPGIPRTEDGKPDLNPRAPKLPDGKPDLPGLARIRWWLRS